MHKNFWTIFHFFFIFLKRKFSVVTIIMSLVISQFIILMMNKLAELYNIQNTLLWFPLGAVLISIFVLSFILLPMFITSFSNLPYTRIVLFNHNILLKFLLNFMIISLFYLFSIFLILFNWTLTFLIYFSTILETIVYFNFFGWCLLYSFVIINLSYFIIRIFKNFKFMLFLFFITICISFCFYNIYNFYNIYTFNLGHVISLEKNNIPVLSNWFFIIKPFLALNYVLYNFDITNLPKEFTIFLGDQKYEFIMYYSVFSICGILLFLFNIFYQKIVLLKL